VSDSLPGGIGWDERELVPLEACALSLLTAGLNCQASGSGQAGSGRKRKGTGMDVSRGGRGESAKSGDGSGIEGGNAGTGGQRAS
jgi:hypothetical protein